MFRRRYLLFVGRILVAAVGVCVASVCYGDAPVEGDAALLKTLVDVQATNLTLFPKGELTAEVREKFSQLDIKATVIWEGSRTYTRFRTKQVIERPIKGKSGEMEAVDSIQEGEMIEIPGVLMVHFPSNHQARRYVEHVAGAGYLRELKLRPDQIWFSYEGDVNLKELISPTSTRAAGVKFVVNREEPDRVIVDRYFGGNAYLRFVASLASGGNIVSFETMHPGPKDISSKGSYAWERDKEGRWYLRELHYEAILRSNPKLLSQDFTLRVMEFNPEPVIPSNRFEFSSFKFEEGTVVEEGLILGRNSAATPGRRTYRVGKGGRTEKNLNETQLNTLSDKQRAARFAAPSRITK